MTIWTRRTVLGSIAGAAAAFAGCFEGSRGSGFKGTEVDGQELVVEFDERLEPDAISVVDPDGEAFAETSVSAGVTRERFEISMPYTSGEYQIIATQGGEEVAEATQEIEPELEIVDVGIGANRMDEMPEELHFPERQVIIEIANQGSGPERVSQLRFSEDFPNNSEQGSEGSGIYSDGPEMEKDKGALIASGDSELLFSTRMPFADLEEECDNEGITTEAEVRLESEVVGIEKTGVVLQYSESESTADCKAEIQLA